MVAGLILAAGSSTRMGRAKQLLDWGGAPLIRHVAQQALAAQLDALYVVLGAQADSVAAALAGLPVTAVRNQDYAAGQSTSLRAGIAALPHSTTAVLILLGDQPFVTPQLIDTLLARAQRSPALVVAPQVAGRRVNPVLFKAALFPQLLGVQGDQGARQVIRAYQADLLLVPQDDTRLALDLDTPEEYERLRPRPPAEQL